MSVFFKKKKGNFLDRQQPGSSRHDLFDLFDKLEYQMDTEIVSGNDVLHSTLPTVNDGDLAW